MTNSRAKGALIMLDKHLAATTEATYTLTKTFKIADYSSILIKVQGIVSATLQLQLKINAATSYYQDGHANEVAVNNNAAAIIELMNTAGLGSEDETFSGTIEIFLSDPSWTNERIFGHIAFYGSGTQYLNSGFMVTTDQSNITSFEIKTSTSTWKAGTQITTYGVRR